jgi:hypothetical protein
MNTKIYNQLRNFAHVAMLFCFIYSIWYYCGAKEYTIGGKIIGMSIGSFVIGAVFGGFWEFCQNVFLKSIYDVKDVLRSAVGGFLGYLFYLSFPSIEFIAKWCSLGFIGLILYSIYEGVILIIKRKEQ